MSKKSLQTASKLNTLKTVKKHNALIQISNYVTAFERHLYNVLLALAQREALQDSSMQHTALLSEVLELMEVDIRNVDFLRQALRALVETTVEFSLLGKDKMDWSASPLLTFVAINDGIVEWHYSKPMAERLGKPSNYTILSLLEERVLDSKYSRALYENIMRYKKIGHTGSIPLDTLYKLLGVQYSDVRDFQKFVLRPALRELHQKLGLSVVEKATKRGRSIVGFSFKVEDTLLAKPKRVNTRQKSIALSATTQKPDYDALFAALSPTEQERVMAEARALLPDFLRTLGEDNETVQITLRDLRNRFL